MILFWCSPQCWTSFWLLVYCHLANSLVTVGRKTNRLKPHWGQQRQQIFPCSKIGKIASDSCQIQAFWIQKVNQGGFVQAYLKTDLNLLWCPCLECWICQIFSFIEICTRMLPLLPFVLQSNCFLLLCGKASPWYGWFPQVHNKGLQTWNRKCKVNYHLISDQNSLWPDYLVTVTQRIIGRPGVLQVNHLSGDGLSGCRLLAVQFGEAPGMAPETHVSSSHSVNIKPRLDSTSPPSP